MTRTRIEAINSYLTDMLSLEEHIEKAVRGQIEDLDKREPEITRVLTGIHQAVERHIGALKSVHEQRKAGASGVAEVVKRAGAAVAGVGAAAIDFIRNEKLPKDLRDDYTAVSLAAIGYVMLHTTATALDDGEIAELSRSHLADHARAVMQLTRILPAAVVELLRDDGLPARDDVLPAVALTIETVWTGAGAETPAAAEPVLRP